MIIPKPGMGLRREHYSYLLKEKPQTSIQWFEAVSENYMDTSGRPMTVLEKIRQDFPIALHGVSMSLGSIGPVDNKYLKSLKKLISQIDPFIVSDHVAWTGTQSGNSHDLLPLPLNQESLENFILNLNQAQDFLGRNIYIENPSTYMSFTNSDIAEWDFVASIAKSCSTKILLDINNIYVASQNHNFDPMVYIDAIPADLIGQIHFAGFTDMGEYLYDTHSRPVYEKVWPLFKKIIQKNPNVPFMMEWDEDIPSFQEVENEVIKATSLWNEVVVSKNGSNSQARL